MRVDVVPHLTPALALGQEYDEALDRRGKGPRLGPPGLRQQGDEVGMRGEEVELRAQSHANPVQGAVALGREVGQGPLQLGCAAGEYRREQSALRVEIVKQQLLVHPCSACDLVHTRSVEPPTREFLAGRSDDL